MYDSIKRDIAQDYYMQNFNNDGQRFVAWYLRNIHLCDPNEARFNVTDGPDDKQIDGVFIDDDSSTVYIIQGKFFGGGSVDAEPLREVLSSWAQLRDLIQLQENCNEKLQRKLVDIGGALEDDYEIVFELIVTGDLTDPAKDDLAVFQRTLADSEDFPASIQVIDEVELERRFEYALQKENPALTHELNLEDGRFLEITIAGTKAVLAAVPLRDCLGFPGIRDGTLFQKNVRQSLGLSNPINKGIKATIYGDKHRDFFFFHNGITAICNHMERENGHLKLSGLSVVNGCQSLNTILSCSERVKELEETYMLVRFYEIPQRERGDRISISTNSQTAVKPRDLRSNDIRVLNLKKSFEQRYTNGYFVTKRGEEAPPEKDKRYVLDLSDLGKCLIAWHSQRPNVAHSETKIFDKYFEQLFKRDYHPEDAQALNLWMQSILAGWVSANPYGLNESLLAMKAYAPYHHLYAVSMCYSISSNLQEMVPGPAAAHERAGQNSHIEQVVKIGAACLNTALEAAANESQPFGRVFSPQNWMRSKTCLAGINAAIRAYLSMLPTLQMPGAREFAEQLKRTLTLPREKFEYRWAAD
jgi:hypothetical protein